MKSAIAVVLAAFVSYNFMFDTAFAQNAQEVKKGSPADELPNLYEKPVIINKVLCPNLQVAFTVHGENHVSGVNNTRLAYNQAVTLINVGTSMSTDAWNGNRFRAPCDGLYFFTVSFVADAYYHGGTTGNYPVDVPSPMM